MRFYPKKKEKKREKNDKKRKKKELRKREENACIAWVGVICVISIIG